ncbi:MAG: prepilin-type N-terminal cleavage/methylation domain-containing protein [Gemmatimonas sp.]
MPAIQFVPPVRARRGVTLLELLVVLVLMGVSAAVVLPVLEPPRQARSDDETAVIAAARHAAIRRGEPVRLRIEKDGVWALVSLREGNTIGSGRVPLDNAHRSSERSGTVDLRIDAMGTCVPSAISVGNADVASALFDPLRCRFKRESSR